MKKYVYKAKDNRLRLITVDDTGKHTSKSYPRVLIETSIGRELLPTEEVHHKDGDVTNNALDNLEIVDFREHRKHHATKYFAREAICEVCGKSFIWTATRQSRYYRDLRGGKFRLITCSKSCSSKYGRLKQLGRV